MTVKRVLLRGRKTPFEVRSANNTLDSNLVLGNSGNLLFLEAAYKLLSASDVDVAVEGGPPRVEDAGRINERFDLYVVPLANAFRAQFQPQLRRLTRLIERLRIPVVILGVGAQSSAGYEFEELRPLEATTKAFLSAVMDRSPAIGVRGEFSHDYIVSLGFKDVEVIGCPSMFWFGPDLPAPVPAPALTAMSRIVGHASPGTAMGSILQQVYESYPGLECIAQDIDTLSFLLTGQGLRESHRELALDHAQPLFRDDRVSYFVDPWPWIQYLRDFDFCFGTRIHGTVAAILAGTPAHVLAHDSRTLELARYFEMPHTAGVSAGLDIASLAAQSDPAAMLAGHRERFARLERFLQRHALRHIFEEGGSRAAAFDARLSSIDFPPPVRLTGGSGGGVGRGARQAVRAHLRELAPRWLRQARRTLRSNGRG